jgi:hypothetical protein
MVSELINNPCIPIKGLIKGSLSLEHDEINEIINIERINNVGVFSNFISYVL